MILFHPITVVGVRTNDLKPPPIVGVLTNNINPQIPPPSSHPNQLLMTFSYLSDVETARTNP